MKVIYTRVSKDPDGTSTSPAAQYEECSRLAEDHGWFGVEHISDVDRSAWSRSTHRPGFHAVVQGIRDASIDGLVVHHLDRLLRQSRELEELIDAIESQTRGRFPIYSVHGDLDLSTSDGRFQARILVSVAQKESDDKSRRLKLVLGQKAREGKQHGGRRPYGWSEDRVTLDPDESSALLDCIGHLLNGEKSLVECARDLGKRPTTLKQILVNPRLAGLRTHHGQVVHVGEWEPLIDHQTHELLVNLLSRPAHENHTTALKHPLIGLLVCGVCGRRLGSRTNYTKGKGSVRKYRCRKDIGGCGLGIDAAGVEQAVEAAFLTLLGHVTVPAPAPVDDRDGERVALEARLDQLARDYYVEGLVTEHEFQVARKGILERLEELGPPHGVEEVPVGDVKDAWENYGPHERAEAMKSVIDHVLVAPGVPGKRFDPTRLSIVAREGVHVRE